MKKCSRCGKKKRGASFSIRNTGALTAWCRSCKRAYDHTAYVRDKSEYLMRNKRNRSRNRAFILACKTRPCLDCNQSFDPCVMDFDHVRGQKAFNLSVGAGLGKGINQIKQEIAKCDVVCSNCHRLRTKLRSLANGRQQRSER